AGRAGIAGRMLADSARAVALIERARIGVGRARGATRLERAVRRAAGGGRAVHAGTVVAVLGAEVRIDHAISTAGAVERDVHGRAVDVGAAGPRPVRRRGPEERVSR